MPHLLGASSSFRVEELTAYDWTGDGDYLCVQIEKRDLTTDAAAALVADACGVRARDVSWAGRKDRRAVTRQWLTVHLGREDALERLRAPDGAALEILAVTRNRQRLRPGDLAGNRFALELGGAAAPDVLREQLAQLAHGGVHNRFGAQRFGTDGSTLRIARAWATGEDLEGQRAASKRFRTLVANAAQAAIFNAVLDARARAGLLHTLRAGDVVLDRDAPRRCRPEDLDALQKRTGPGDFRVRTTGPLPGSLRLRPSPEIDAEERDWSTPAAIDWSWLEAPGPLASAGARRALLVPFLEPPNLEPGDPTLLHFALPPGSYATEVLRQAGVDLPQHREP